MDLLKFLTIGRRYMWLFVLATLISSITTFLVLSRQPTAFEAKTQLLVGPSLESPSPDLNSLRIGGQLIQTYAELVQTRSFLEAVNSKLNEKSSPESLSAMIETRQNIETRILTIFVRHPDPKQAVAIANAAAETLIEIGPSKDNSTTLLRAQMSSQSRQLEQIVTNAETSIKRLEAELIALGNTAAQDPAAAQAALEQQNLIIAQLAEERAILSDALRTLATVYQVMLDTNTNQLEIVEPAEVVLPINQSLPLKAAASGVAGLTLTMSIIFGSAYFDDRIRFPGDFAKAAGVPVLSTIDKQNGLRGTGTERLVTFVQPNSRAANSYRTAVAKLLFSIGESMPYTYLLSSVGSRSGDDASAVTANLAVAFAQAGFRVGLIDAQLHNPVLTMLFNANDRSGLSDFLVTNSTNLQLVPVKEIPNVRFLSAGLSSERGSSAILNSARIDKLIAELQKEADIVLVAGSSISWFAETLTLASHVNGLILVAREGEARSKVVNVVVENLSVMNTQLAGVIFDYNPSPFVSQQKVSDVADVSSENIPEPLPKSGQTAKS